MSDVLNFKKGERIISKGDKATSAYMVLSGKVRVFLEEGSKVIELAVLGQEEIFGETAIFLEETYGANVEAAEDCEILEITPETMNEKLKGADPIVQTLLHMLIKRLKKTNQSLLKSETREFIDVGLI